MSNTPARRSQAERWLEATLVGVFLLALAVNLGNTLARGALGTSALWADEAQQFALVWLAFLGAALATVQRNHLRVGVLRSKLPLRTRQVVVGLEALLLPLLCGLTTFESFKYVQQIAFLGVRSDMAGIPMWLPHMAVTLGFGLMTALELVRLPGKLAESR